MSFIMSIESMRQAYSIYKLGTNFISKTESVIEEIGTTELQAALNSIRDMRISSCPERELNMALTQLRSALQLFDSKSNSFFVSNGLLEKRWKTSFLISLCYYTIHENKLCSQFRQKSELDFSEWLESYSNCGSGKLYWKEEWYDTTKNKVNEIGLLWSYSKPESTFWGGFSSDNHRNFDKAYTEHKNAIKQQYASIIERLTT